MNASGYPILFRYENISERKTEEYFWHFKEVQEAKKKDRIILI